ncbi:filamentous hemagglutinin N-terminal domain-containing protein [Nostoc sp. ChiQUE01b]|uniref:two-partner secretion domain-containing protein n=1 Tax=Nostoc sp. ChiQUE01b TaxID=3075376 RepID=UPI002AD3D85B|nr:filamentous hemagglutinin N-terminal domain-containing protein [Nostoc sp. ChiQUE01b]MDZ8257036.1 filamentous hemagglutinin N-terminal domain-containing protein [Nostoc sp. ChiQUE01b]
MNQAHHPQKASIKSLLCLCLISTAFSQASPAQAQITPDNTLGAEASRLNQNLIINGILGDKIDGGAIRGSNLFHSFSEFNIENGQRVYFANPTGIENILTRVTGRNASNIFGTLGVDGAANLFLINPNGILFGQNARLDVQGSFVGTTANGVQFGNQGIFSATNPQAPPLLTVNPSALFFNQINQGAVIQNNSIARAGTDPAGFNASGLRVPDGKSLLLVGGNVSMDGGQLNAYGGRVELGGLVEAGSIGIQGSGNSLSLSFPSGVGRGDISLTNGAYVNVAAGGGGSIAVNARNLNISEVSRLTAGVVSGEVDSKAGNIAINATDTVTIDGTSSTDTSSQISNILSQGSGTLGDVIINTGSLNVIGNAQIGSASNAQGDAGNVIILAKDKVSFSGTNSGVLSAVGPLGIGNGANINIRARSLSLANGAQIATSTLGKGSAGNIQINADDSVFVSNGSIIHAVTFGQGNAGNITIEAGNTISFDGIGSNNVSSGAYSAVRPFAIPSLEFTKKRSGGDITITSEKVSLTNGAQLEASTYGQGNAGNVTVDAKNAVDLVSGDIFSTVEAGGVGKGGNIDINATTLSLTDGAQLLTATREASATQPAGKGDAGNVNVLVTGAVDIAGEKNDFPSGIRSNVETGTVGNGGNIFIDSGSFSLSDGAELVASTYGQGNAGNVSVLVTGAVDIAGEKNNFHSGIRSIVGTGTVGNGGNITIDSGSFSLSDGAQIEASTYGQGNAGNVTVGAKNAVFLAGGDIFSAVEAGGVGKGGNIDINAATLSLTDGAQLLTITRGASATQPAGRGDAGNVNVLVTGTIDIAGKKNGFSSAIFSSVDTGTVGNGGNIFIDSSDLSLSDGALLNASTYGQGNAGNVTVDAKNAVFLAGNAYILSAVEAGGVGKGGNIDINAATLSLTDGAQLITITRAASATQPAGRGDAGNVNVKVTGAVDIAGEKNDFLSAIFSLVDTGTVGNGGNIFIDSSDLSLSDGAQLVASTFGQGNAGNIRINAKDTVTVSGTNQETGLSSALFTFTYSNSQGKGGDINVNTNIFRVSDGALLDARTRNNQKGGDITVNANVFEALNGGQLTTISSSNGRAGKITVNADEKLIISGSDSNYSDRIANFPDNVANIGANSGLFVSSTGSGITGDIEINSPKITLDNQGKLNAESASGNGGNINANSDFLLLRHGAQISTSAGTEKLGGDGGNINLNSRFIVAVPGENSDITANAFTGSGGNIQINSQGIFGIESRPKLTEKSDITASSELGVSGVTNINTPDNSSIQNSFTGLSPNVIDTNALIANSCISRATKRQENSFTITGSGALRYTPGDVLTSAYTTGDVRSVEPTPRPWKKGDPIIEPQGLYRLPNGQLILSRSC